jgi:serine/threonine-protein kinase
MSNPMLGSAEAIDAKRFRVEGAPGQAAAPRRLGDYLLLERLARGGMSEVWLAKQAAMTAVEKFCIVKTIRPHLTSNREYNARFIDEARTVVQLSHRNICQVFDVGLVVDQYYLAMELVAGYDFRTLFERAAAAGTVVDERVALHLLCEMLEALDYAHRLCDVATGEPLRLVHRDVSPHNALVNLEGEVKLIDFGLAQSTLKLERTEPGVVLGKLAYMAPEHARGERVDSRVDQFSAAVVGIELLTGAHFYGMATPDEIWREAGRGTWRPPELASVVEPLRAILNKALDPDPEQRHASCGVMRRALVEAQSARGVVCGTAEVRALLDRLVPDAREVHRVRMMNAAAAARSSLPQRAVESTRIAHRPSSLDDRTATESEDVPVRVDRTAEEADTSATTRLPLLDRTMVVVRARRGRPGARRAVFGWVTAAGIVGIVGVIALWLRQHEATNDGGAVVAVPAPSTGERYLSNGEPGPIVEAPPALPTVEASPARAMVPVQAAEVATVADTPSRPLKSRRASVRKAKQQGAPGVETLTRGPQLPASTVARVQLPASAPLSIPDLIRALEISCVDRVPCATGLRASWVRASEIQSLEATRTVRAAANRCFTECKRSTP